MKAPDVLIVWVCPCGRSLRVERYKGDDPAYVCILCNHQFERKVYVLT